MLATLQGTGLTGNNIQKQENKSGNLYQELGSMQNIQTHKSNGGGPQSVAGGQISSLSQFQVSVDKNMNTIVDPNDLQILKGDNVN